MAVLRQECPEHVQPHIEATIEAKNPQLVFFDEHITRFLGGSSPPFPFASAKDYYQWASSYNYLPGIRVPFLAVNAMDDTVSPVIPIPIPEQASYVILAITTRGGGHLGWFEGGRDGWWNVERWIKKPIMEWVRATGEELVVPHASQFLSDGTIITADGFTSLKSNPKIGFREIRSEMVMTTDDVLRNFEGPLSI